MKPFSSLLSVGCLGFVALQGCAGTEYTGDAQDVGAQESAIAASCYSSNGVHPTKAALAVAMGIELGRWEPNKDLVRSTNGSVALNPAAVCVKNSCKQTKALLGQIHFSADWSRFNPENYKNDLWASLDRQTNLIADITRNRPSVLPPAHKLTLRGGPLNLGSGACGPHYVFQVDNLNGKALTSAQASNMSNALCFYGQNTYGTNCGDNQFVGFTKTQVNCPAGRVCVAIDPDDGDAGSGTTTKAGSAPTYTLNRLWDPGNGKLNAQCTRTAGPVGRLQSKCAPTPNTCGYLYCM